jgi:MATE family multidrug resistance protein
MTAPVPVPYAEFRAELGRMFRLSVPLVGASAGTQLMSLVDTAVVGRLGPVEIAANGMGTTIFFLTSILALGTVLGLDPLAAQAVGAGRPGEARRHFREAVWLALMLSVPFGALCFALHAALPAIGVEAAVRDATLAYLWARAPSMVPFLLFIVLRSYLQALGRTRPSLVAMIIGNVVNLPLAWVLVHGDEGLLAVGLPPVGFGAGLGVLGAGLACTLGHVVQLGVLALAVRGEPAPPDAGRATLAGVRTLIGLGLPVGFQFLAEMGVFGTTQMLMGRFGAVWTAAHNVAIQLASFTFCVCLGVSQAASVRVGHEVGRGDWQAARRAGLVALVFGTGVMSLSAMVFLVAPGWLAGALADPPEVVEAAAGLLVIAAGFQLFDGAQVIGGGALRGAGDTRAAMWINLGVHWLVTAPLVLGLGVLLGYGPHGMWWALTLGLTLVSAGLVWRFLRLTAGHMPGNS